MKKGKYDKKACIIVISILIVINIIVFLLTNGWERGVFVNTVFYMLEIIVTIWLISDKHINGR